MYLETVCFVFIHLFVVCLFSVFRNKQKCHGVRLPHQIRFDIDTIQMQLVDSRTRGERGFLTIYFEKYTL